jgi:PHP family Zn ribbon phosphoesterase
MSPKNIVLAAVKKNLDIIGITDHNSTRQCRIVAAEAEKLGLTTYMGVEVTTKEEIHCLAYFDSVEKLEQFQKHLDTTLPNVKNNPDLFGYQVVVDENENITYEEEKLLISALSLGIDQVEELVHQLDGIFIPAHVNKSKDSITSQLGFIPSSLKADALELTKFISTENFQNQNPNTKRFTFIHSSDAHQLATIGDSFTYLQMKSTSFSEFYMALNNIEGRKVVVQ